MTAQIGADGADLFGDPDLELLTDVAGVQPELGRDWVHLIDQLGFQSTQRLWIGECDNGVAVATWPAELQPQARYLYVKGLGSRGYRAQARMESRGVAPHCAPHSRVAQTALHASDDRTARLCGVLGERGRA
jgi:hypothetical protein